MVTKKKKPFIDKNKSTTYRLLHRSQRDPLIVDDKVGQHVLHPVSGQVLFFYIKNSFNFF